MTRRHGLAPLGAGLIAALAAACADSAPTQGTDAGAAATPEPPSGAHAPLGRTIYGVDDAGTLVVFDGDRPTAVSRRVRITRATGGIVGGILGIDFRPNDQTPANGDQTGVLYAVDGTGAVYTVDPTTGVATLRAQIPVALLTAGGAGVGFNPMADRLRIHTDASQNLRVDVETGATTEDRGLTYAAGDVNAGERNPDVVATAYTNSVAPAPASTELFAIDARQDVLVKLNAPNDGQLTTVGRLVVDNGEQVGFDISGRSTDRTGYATFTPPRYTRSFLYRINLDNAAREPVGPVGHDRPIVSIAIDDVGSAGAAEMSFFVTSAGPGDGANLGGLAGADASCQQLATAVGAGGRTWRAYLSTSAVDGQPAVNARDRIGQGPWYNVRGALVARTVAELHAEAPNLTKETALTERGDVVLGSGDTPNQHDILTGSQADGTAFSEGDDRTCRNWTSNAADGSAQVGHHDRRGTGGNPPNSWNSAHASRGCGQANLRTTGGAGLFYCFAR
ncbi:MAG: FIG00440539: hypothetical protein [uncultured Gemmatimonadaceae bacterium]|uniref:DUF4394 domain-containing protein n=1 Tax=uncultured Gemmatimonadaceae bacterium TaxID=246130 RepID=A0A6J4LSP7_9BACT|nr:MAG: FIG00440539: hypothetical protein [uncultured Gemmatimonadaceae bacterium]